MWYRIDAVDRISAVSSDWQDEAERLGAPERTARRVVGRPIWHFFEGEATFLRYATLFETVRQTSQSQAIWVEEAGRTLELTLQPMRNQSINIVSRADVAATAQIPLRDPPLLGNNAALNV